MRASVEPPQGSGTPWILGERRCADRRQELARRGERAAERLLLRSGMRLLQRRFRCPAGEIDLIAEDRETLVFVEVKTRSGVAYGPPAAAVDRRKRQRMVRVALTFLQRRRWLERPCRFDVVEVLVRDPRPAELRHLRDAFRLRPRG